MAEADAMMNKFRIYVFQLPIEQQLVRTQTEIEAACGHHRQLLLCMDEYFSGLQTKRYHLIDKIRTKAILYRNQSLAIMRHMSMSVTPKGSLHRGPCCPTDGPASGDWQP